MEVDLQHWFVLIIGFYVKPFLGQGGVPNLAEVDFTDTVGKATLKILFVWHCRPTLSTGG